MNRRSINFHGNQQEVRFDRPAGFTLKYGANTGHTSSITSTWDVSHTSRSTWDVSHTSRSRTQGQPGPGHVMRSSRDALRAHPTSPSHAESREFIRSHVLAQCCRTVVDKGSSFFFKSSGVVVVGGWGGGGRKGGQGWLKTWLLPNFLPNDHGLVACWLMLHCSPVSLNTRGPNTLTQFSNCRLTFSLWL